MIVIVLICLASAPVCDRANAVQAIRAPQIAASPTDCLRTGMAFAASLTIGPREGEQFVIECRPSPKGL